MEDNIVIAETLKLLLDRYNTVVAKHNCDLSSRVQLSIFGRLIIRVRFLTNQQKKDGTQKRILM